MNRIIPRAIDPRQLSTYGRRLECDSGNTGLLASAKSSGQAGATSILKPEFESLVQGSEPENMSTYRQIRDVICDVEKRSEEIDALDDIEGKDGMPGLGVRSPESSPSEYSLDRDMLNWANPDREAFHFHQPASPSSSFERLEFKRLESNSGNYEIYAAQKGDADAPTSIVIFDTRENSYTLLNDADLQRSQQENQGFL